jgi:hypothetical protein
MKELPMPRWCEPVKREPRPRYRLDDLLDALPKVKPGRIARAKSMRGHVRGRAR